MADLIEKRIRNILGSQALQLDDSAVLEWRDRRLAFTTDTYTITPLFFPGGDIGSLAVNGTVNDLAVLGATPLYLSCGLILEEGLEMETLERILVSIKRACGKAKVKVVTGDTKVVEKGSVDRIFINTSGIGVLKTPVQRKEVVPGDRILISGTIGDHGIAIMAHRTGLSFSRGLVSDCAPLNKMIGEVITEFPDAIKFMRDPTRGGVASVLNEIVKNQPFGAVLSEDRLPLKKEVVGVCDILGIDPLYAANEGKVVMVVEKKYADDIIDKMKGNPQGRDAAVIGEMTGHHQGMVYVETPIGGKRMLPLLLADQLPRIC